MTLMLWPFLVFRATYIFDINSAKRKEIKWRKMPRMNGFIKNHVVDFLVETSERVKPCWPLWNLPASRSWQSEVVSFSSASQRSRAGSVRLPPNVLEVLLLREEHSVAQRAVSEKKPFLSRHLVCYTTGFWPESRKMMGKVIIFATLHLQKES